MKLIIIATIFAVLIFPAFSLAQEATEEAKLSVTLSEPLGTTDKIEGNSGVEFISAYIKGIYVWGAGLVGIIAVLNMVIAGIQITTAADSDRAASAKTRIVQSIIALCVLFLSGVLLKIINPTFFT